MSFSIRDRHPGKDGYSRCGIAETAHAELSRRGFLRGSLSFAFASPALTLPQYANASPRNPDSPRVVSLDNGLTQIALSVGIVPVAVSRPASYRRLVVEPALPEGVVDVGGNVDEPSLELLRLLKPDLVLVNEGVRASVGAVLSQVAPLMAPAGGSLVPPAGGFGMSKGDSFSAAVRQYELTCDALGRRRRGEDYTARVSAFLDRLHTNTKPFARRPLLLLSGIDRRHSYVLVRNSIFQGVLDRLGLVNAWHSVAMPLGMSVVGLEEIAPLEDATIVIIDGSGNVSKMMASPLWQAMRPVREGRVVSLPRMWTVGGLPVAERFARYLVPALETLEARHV